jgi:hypothetical protein
MRTLIAAALFLLGGVSMATAQDADSLASRTTIDASLTLSQSTYSDNWTGGDAGNFAWIAIVNAGRQIYHQQTWHWRNTLNLSYGQTHAQDPETNTWRKPTKSTDKIDFESLLRYLRWATLPPYASVRALSQFEDASVANHKLYLNPILITEAAGLSRQVYKQGDDEVLTRAGLALRELIQRRWTDVTYAKKETETSTDGGFEWVTDVAYKIPGSSIVYKSRLSTFKALFYSKSDDLKGSEKEDYWKAVDVNWENTFSAQVSKYIGVALYLQWLYDKEVDLAGRFKQTLAVGFLWKNL